MPTLQDRHIQCANLLGSGDRRDRDTDPIPKAAAVPLNIHHHWRVEHAPEGGSYRRCTKCGKDDPRGFSEDRPGDIIAGG